MMLVSTYSLASNLSDAQKCQLYKTAPQKQVESMVRTDLLAIDSNKQDRKAIKAMSFSQLLPAGYKLYCSTSFDKKNVIAMTFGRVQDYVFN